MELSGGIENQSPNTQIINLPLTLIDGSQTIDTAAGNVVIAGSIDQNGGSLGVTKTGSGTLVLSGTNTYSGGTTVLAGILQLTNSNALASGSSLTVRAGQACRLAAARPRRDPTPARLPPRPRRYPHRR